MLISMFPSCDNESYAFRLFRYGRDELHTHLNVADDDPSTFCLKLGRLLLPFDFKTMAVKCTGSYIYIYIHKSTYVPYSHRYVK